MNLNELNRHGLNLQAVFNLDTLPDEIMDQLARQAEHFDAYNQIVLLAHGGSTLWSRMQEDLIATDSCSNKNPIDNFTVDKLTDFFQQALGEDNFEFIYPSNQSIPLQQLGKLAGWHHDSPLKLGIHPTFGLWFAYRAAVLIKAAMPVTQVINTISPCQSCEDKPCIAACPSQAVTTDKFNLASCMNYRMEPSSTCGYQCISRRTCPIGIEHTYTKEQMTYHYGNSLNTIKRWKKK